MTVITSYSIHYTKLYEDLEDLHRILEAIQDNGQRSVLATITHVEGSAYRKEGALMLFFEDGSQIGVLSAGCLETDLAARVPEILAAGVSCGFVFDVQSVITSYSIHYTKLYDN